MEGSVFGLKKWIFSENEATIAIFTLTYWLETTVLLEDTIAPFYSNDDVIAWKKSKQLQFFFNQLLDAILVNGNSLNIWGHVLHSSSKGASKNPT